MLNKAILFSTLPRVYISLLTATLNFIFVVCIKKIKYSILKIKLYCIKIHKLSVYRYNSSDAVARMFFLFLDGVLG